MKTRRIALVMAGGVSLGSYEAGVLTELLYALETLNASAGAGDPRYELDVMTGGSAGGMTGAIVGRMMFEMPARRDALFNAWVRDIDIVPLLNGGDIPKNALLSKRIIGEIAERSLVSAAPAGPASPASYAPQTLRLSLSISNMNGVTYRIPYANAAGGATSFMTTFFADMARFTVDRDRPQDTDWRQVRDACISSGNFPIAFRPQRMVRDPDDYPGAQEAEDPASSLFEQGMTFVDGGLFNNEPLGEAIRRAAEADRDGEDVERLFILIDPFINTSKHNAEFSPDDELIKVVMRLVTMIRGESTARDWLRAERINDQLRWRREFVEELKTLVAAVPDAEAPGMARHTAAMTREIVASQRDLEDQEGPPDLRTRLPRDESFTAARAQLSGEDRRDVFDRLVFALDEVAGLSSKSMIELKAIDADETELAGETLQGFGGFFEREWREHDFRVGRRKAHGLLPGILGRDYDREKDAAGQLVRDYELPPDWREFKHKTLADTGRGPRKQVRDIMLDRSVDLLKDVGIKNPVYRWGARMVLKRVLNGVLSL
ncbi:MAG: patatin-like phospholipase family protein [Acidobacteriota bacterium]